MAKRYKYRAGAIGVLLLLGTGMLSCREKAPEEKALSSCKANFTQLHGIRRAGTRDGMQLQVFAFPASAMLDNSDADTAATCTFEIEGPNVSKDNLFFRYGREDAEKIEVSRLGKNHLRIRYPIGPHSYGLVSLEPPLKAPEDPYEFVHHESSCRLEGCVYLRQEGQQSVLRLLGPAAVVHLHNDSDGRNKVDLVIENFSSRLSDYAMRGEGGAGDLRLSNSKPLELSLKGNLGPGENACLMITARRLPYPFSFIFGGDIKQHLPTFERLVSKVVQKSDPLFMLAVGDYTRNSLPAELDTFFNSLKRLAFPVCSVKGNHEARCQGDVHYARLFGPSRYEFTVDRLLFLVLDSNRRTRDGYTLGGEQLAWLDERLAVHGEIPFKIVALHVPPHPLHGKSLRPEYSQNLASEDARRLFELAEKHQVSYVLSGHAHLWARRQDAGVIYLTSGGGGAALYSHNPLPGFSIDTRKHLMLMHVHADGIEEEKIFLADE